MPSITLGRPESNGLGNRKTAKPSQAKHTRRRQARGWLLPPFSHPFDMHLLLPPPLLVARSI